MRRAWVAIVLCFLAGPAAAALFAATSVEEAARSSDAVVRGTVVSARGRVTAGGRRVVTDVDIAVSSAWKGTPGETVRVVVPGGSTAALGMHVDGAPSFQEGEEVVVFLGRAGPSWQVMGLAAGKYRVVGTDARPAFAPEDVRPRALAAGERAAGPMPLVELERRVRAAR
jgi:hypothetical protein